MKTSIKTITTICAVVISLTSIAQPRKRDNGNSNGSTKNDDKRIYASAGYSQWSPWGGGVSVQVGNYPNYPNYGGNYYYGNGYGNYHNLKKAARNSIRQSARIIGNALEFSDWNDMYSPWLAKAIRHQQYARQLYFWGDYAGALNHAERAGFLAWNTLSYFNSYYGYDDGFAGNGYPNPYSDPNNPYYRKNNSGKPNGTDNSDDFGYRKDSSSSKTEVGEDVSSPKKIENDAIDQSLPSSKLSDRELLKTSNKDLDVE